ncbi:protein Brevis radix-like 4 [Salvia splendens]|nr:protein Brevis radix-like 4 [Salvia splendens]
MLTCIARSKQASDESPSIDHRNPPSGKLNSESGAAPSKHAIKSLSSQIKDMALKASGAYRHCAPCANQSAAPPGTIGGGGGEQMDLAAAQEKFRWSYRRTGSSSSGRRELEARLKGISSGEGTPASASGRRIDPIVFVEENEPKEWVAQVEPGVLITFLSLPRGGNDLKRIRFSRDMFNQWQAQRWWAENSEKVLELYNVQRLNLQGCPLPTTPISEDDTSSKMDSSPVTPPLGREPPPRAFLRPTGTTKGYSTDSLDLTSTHSIPNYESTPKLSSISGAKTEASSSMRTSSMSNASDLETEWVEQDEPGVYITIRALPDGRRELRRVRFSRDKFGEIHAKMWWEENRGRIHKQYL